ncbi:hypothetical protein HELRODRAFT_181225 [Helobdella robusta]|uniref:Uncharacterized protein n=1 Tax=Helobdella robusta TaxID=6412 RepID=T1FGS0_HELRO|nr:hypothetical protein HELRODRAFT_181225 [Helobdella robusta]ESN93129.1 hypothetical protein HELRODRAFT_181225 [Helobdella robusta]
MNILFSSLDSISRKSSRVPSIDTRSRLSHSSLIGTYIHEAEEKSMKVGIDCKKSLEASISTGSIILPVPCDLPGIHISRIETLDFDDMSMLSGFGQLGSRRYIIIESDGLSDCSKMSIPNSECSFSMCSRSSRSRSSKDSSNFGSRIWDFSSPRESEWEVNVPNNLRLDTSNGYTNLRHSSISSNTNQNPSFLSPMMPRKGSTVTFGKNETTGRRHSSPASSFRKKEGRNVSHAPNLTHENNFSTANNSGITPKQQSRDASNNGSKIESSNWLFASQQAFYGTSAYRKKSAGDQSLMSIIIDENDGDEDEENKNAGVMDESNNNHALSGPIKFSREPLNPYIKSSATIHQQNLSANIADKENICEEKKSSMIQECYDDSDENVSNKCISFLKSKLEVNEDTRKNADRGMHDNEKKEIELRRSTASFTKCKETDVKDKSMNHSGTEKTMTRQKFPTFAANFKPKFRETNLKNSNLSERDLHSEKKHADNFNYELLKKESTEKTVLGKYWWVYLKFKVLFLKFFMFQLLRSSRIILFSPTLIHSYRVIQLLTSLRISLQCQFSIILNRFPSSIFILIFHFNQPTGLIFFA